MMDPSIGETERLINNDIFLSTAPSPSASRLNESRSGTGILGTIFLIVNTTLGAGMLNFPQAFDKSGGIATSILTQLVFLIFITMTLIILADCSNVTNTCTMQDTFAILCGSKLSWICSLCVAIYSFGCCLTFLIIIGDQFDRVFATFYGPDFCHNWYFSREFTTTATGIIFVLPFCFFKRLDLLSYTSVVGCVTIVYVMIIIILESVYSSDDKPIKIWPDNGYEALKMIPIICFAYQSHMTAIPTYACMKDRRLGKFALCSIISMIVCFGVYTTVGIFGYLSFGIGKVPSDILQGYSDKSIPLSIAIIFVAVKNFTTYPIVLFCGRDAFFSMFTTNLTTVNDKIRFFVTVLWFVLSLLLAILVPDISPVINLLGTLSATFIFIFPGICWLQSILTRDPELHLNKDRLNIIIAIFVIALGAFVGGIVFVQSLQDFNRKPSEPPLVTGFKTQLGESLCT